LNGSDPDIQVWIRRDGSGTTDIFTTSIQFMDPTSISFFRTDGVDEPMGVDEFPQTLKDLPNFGDTPGNIGVFAQVSTVEWSIGYVSFAFAKGENLPFARLKKNDSMGMLVPDASFLQIAMDSVDFGDDPDHVVADLVDVSGTAWPIAGLSYMLLDA